MINDDDDNHTRKAKIATDANITLGQQGKKMHEIQT